MMPKRLLITLFAVALSRVVLAQQAPVPDSITIAINTKFDKAGKVKRALLGTNYRRVWAQAVRMPIFHITQEKGGLKITGVGGGNQTTSLQMKDSAGREWVLRSANKTTSRDQPKIYKNTLVEALMLDAGSIGHPWSALAVPPMADALGIKHTNPRMVYLPDDPALGKYREQFANAVYLFEEHGPPDASKDYKTEKVQDRLEKNNDNKVDQRLILRARILDMIMGDWDRHGGQWKWTKNNDSTKAVLYDPTPGDRDKVFYTTGGAIFSVMALAKPNLQAYTDHIRRVDLWNYNTVTFDLYFLNELDKEDWEHEIAYVQSKLTDSLVTRAVKLMPANVYAVSGEHILKTFFKRRDNARKFVMRYYHFLAKIVDIHGSDKPEHFGIHTQKDGDVKITINNIKKDGSVGRELYKRTFKQHETNDIRLYGLEGQNTWEVTGDAKTDIKVRMIGGTDTDSYHVDTTLHNRKNLYVYDVRGPGNALPAGSEVHLKLRNDTSINQYRRPENRYTTYSPLGGIGYSTEDGLQLVAGIGLTQYSFRKDPYRNHQELKINYTLSKQSFLVNYTGIFKSVWGKNTDLLVNVSERGPRNTNNFFGLGNVGEYLDDKEFYYYRNRYDYAVTDVRLAHRVNNWVLSGGSLTEFYTSSRNHNQDHFFKQYDQLHPEERLFDAKLYTGVIGGAVYDSRNSQRFPSRGVTWRNTLTGLTGINVNDHASASIISTFSFFIPIKDSTIVLANRTGAGHIFGNGEFFQMMNLGGLTLQGFHTSRFIGHTMAYNNLELRAKLFDFNAYVLASSFGLVAFNDAGRVWLKGEHSNTLHDTYGGGIFLTPYNAFLLQAVLGKSTDGYLSYITVGFRF
ncbi:BamA/TamA family outer membrane protein [Mucilaginibacter pedocola]|uniref:Bacterial surface antigen (D15) domain-containing protein n=1 Tax=Mucilaginibacter pedocola TaxID=1792845 RepID=A0A1S9PAK8_9SPHI|nr:hypothetical protein [Mucilaginibacter pedocola]OOQ57985.1 hypothetical protein BC343_09960 [Mucilaginibacter pedocola]